MHIFIRQNYFVWQCKQIWEPKSSEFYDDFKIGENNAAQKVLGKYVGKFCVFQYCVEIFVQGVLSITIKGNN